MDLIPDDKLLASFNENSANAPALIAQARAIKEEVSRLVLILPYHDAGTMKFLAHDVVSDQTFVLPAPVQDADHRPLGEPQLVSTPDDLYHLQAASHEKSGDFLYQRHRFVKKRWSSKPLRASYSRWPFLRQSGNSRHHEVPLTITGFLVPISLPREHESMSLKSTSFPIVQKSYMDLRKHPSPHLRESREVVFVEGLNLEVDVW